MVDTLVGPEHLAMFERFSFQQTEPDFWKSASLHDIVLLTTVFMYITI